MTKMRNTCSVRRQGGRQANGQGCGDQNRDRDRMQSAGSSEQRGHRDKNGGAGEGTVSGGGIRMDVGDQRRMRY